MAEMKQFGIDLELDDAVAQGHYSNLAIISHSTSEFIIDFAAVLPGVQKARAGQPCGTDRKSEAVRIHRNIIPRAAA